MVPQLWKGFITLPQPSIRAPSAEKAPGTTTCTLDDYPTALAEGRLIRSPLANIGQNLMRYPWSITHPNVISWYHKDKREHTMQIRSHLHKHTSIVMLLPSRSLGDYPSKRSTTAHLFSPQLIAPRPINCLNSWVGNVAYYAHQTYFKNGNKLTRCQKTLVPQYMKSFGTKTITATFGSPLSVPTNIATTIASPTSWQYPELSNPIKQHSAIHASSADR